MKSTLCILCLEDDIDDFNLIKRALTRGGLSFNAILVQTRESFINALASLNPDLILSDHSLPAFDSTDALLIARKKFPDLPFVLVTGAMSDEFAVKSLKLGVDDYVLKSNLQRLPSVIENVLKQKENEVAKRIATLELAKRNEELSKINRELDSFVYSVSHNLRAPLMSVMGLLSLARQEKSEEVLEKYHKLMEQSIVKLDSTLKDILEYARNAREGVKHEPVDFDQIIDDNFQKMEFMPGFQSLSKKKTVNKRAPFCSDVYRLSIIFNNLISNAVKYADHSKESSGIEIAVDVNEERALIEFSDNGIGIASELQPKVFDMFFRATQLKEGAGLGLFIVREAVEIIGGSVRVDSEFGRGTCFRIEVPNQCKDHSAISNSAMADLKGCA